MVADPQLVEDRAAFGPDAVHAMSVAFDEICRSLRLESDASAREAVAIRIVDLARRGERNATRLRDRVLREASLEQ